MTLSLLAFAIYLAKCSINIQLLEIGAVPVKWRQNLSTFCYCFCSSALVVSGTSNAVSSSYLSEPLVFWWPPGTAVGITSIHLHEAEFCNFRNLFYLPSYLNFLSTRQASEPHVLGSHTAASTLLCVGQRWCGVGTCCCCDRALNHELAVLPSLAAQTNITPFGCLCFPICEMGTIPSTLNTSKELRFVVRFQSDEYRNTLKNALQLCGVLNCILV